MVGMSDAQFSPVPPAPVMPATPGIAEVRRPGRALAITGMAVGLAALMTVAVAPLTSLGFAVGGAMLGIAAAIVGVLALVLRQPRVPAIAGLAGGALAVVLALVLGAVSVGSYLTSLGHTGANGPGANASPDPSLPGPSAPNPPEAGSLIWPQNHATGGVVFTGPERTVRPSDAPREGAAPSPLPARELGAPALIQVYQDYRCPYCAHFAQASGDTLEAVLDQEAAAVEIHALTFLDRVSADSYYSSRAAGALACIADTHPAAAWDANTALLDPAFQPAEGGPGPDTPALVATIEDATGPLPETTRSCIAQESYVPFAAALTEWVFAHPVPHAKDPGLGVSGTPLVVVNGVPYPGDPADARAFRAFLAQQGVMLT